MNQHVAAEAPDGAGRLSWIARASFCALSALFIYFIVYDFHRLSVGHYGDFPTYYDSARAMLDGRDPYQKWGEMYYVYPPLFAFLVTPLARLSLYRAEQVFLGINLAAMAAGLLAGAWAMHDRLGGAPSRSPRVARAAALGAVALFAALLTENTIRGAVQSQETDVLMFASFALAFYWLDRRPVLAGLTLAFALNIKYLPIVALPWLLLRRRWTAAGSFVVGAVGFALLPALLVGWKEDVRCIRVALAGPIGWLAPSGSAARDAEESPAPGDAGDRAAAASHSAAGAHVLPVTDNVSLSITSAFARLEASRGQRSLKSILPLVAGIALACMALAIWLYRRNGLPCWVWPTARLQQAQPFYAMIALEWAGLITMALAFSPDTNPRHLVLVTLVSAAAAAALLADAPRQWSRRPLAIGAGLLCVALLLPWKGVMSHGFFLAWYRSGIPCWCLLVTYATLLASGLRLCRLRLSAPASLAQPHPANALSPPAPGGAAN